MARTATKRGADGLSRDTVVDRALALADADGLDAVTIRRLGQELGVTPMALYWHVSNKDELLDAMGDRIYESVRLDYASTAPWDEQLGAIVLALIEAFRRHPSCTELAYRRVFSCPDGQRLAEYTYDLLRTAGFDVRQTTYIGRLALQTAVMLVSGEPGAEPNVMQDERERVVEEKRRALMQLPADQYPRIHEMAADLFECDNTDEYYEFGVDLFVAGARTMLTP
jgi:TetR/AcrR family tetracycline transcriptional repressor